MRGRRVAPTRTGTAWWHNRRRSARDLGLRVHIVERDAIERAKKRKRKANKAARSSRKVNR